MNVVLLYLLLLKATITSFSGLASLPVVRNDMVVHYQMLTDRELNTAVAVGRAGPGPIGLYVVSVVQITSEARLQGDVDRQNMTPKKE